MENSICSEIRHQTPPATGEHFLQLASKQESDENFLDPSAFPLEEYDALRYCTADLPDFENANVEALVKGDLSPLVREELRYSILRRCNGALKAEYKESTVEELSPEEQERRDARREKNKMAARKCRDKKKQTIQDLVKKNNDLESQNTSLRYQIRQLQKEKNAVQRALDDHLAQCPLISS
ncbi:cyclic AMP-dependent transcription factor ATF-3 [Lingula anatina]|uniref:Cyclic AMP-dependent transcription factor ATF-3 n=1 Tax=Lingula anatina TaxID=7574 RepID=A0A1S3IL62_LINAN|nr:cyclic AMP-dependent transcription factor ATF-3 [Lingula anatina]|eukprot:XP_013398259.1 cyclic AMP-dependent transcription factor ATF-3 [Lingula anatina]